MKYSEKLYNIIGELNSFHKSHKLATSPAKLQEPIDYVLGNTGKMIRPILCYLTHNLYADSSDDMYYASWGIEYFHNFTLMHDDIMDDAATRRGQESSYKKYGTNQTILSGDALNILAYMLIQNIGRDMLPDVLRSFNRTALDVCEGQQMDMDFESEGEVDYAQYLNMIKLKTASLFALSCELGACTTGIGAEEVSKMYDFGENLGMAFQLLDDYLDTFGEEGEVGKKIGGDILMRKKTCVYIKSLYQLPKGEQESFRNMYNNSTKENLSAIIAKMRDLGVADIIHGEIKQYTDRAIEILDSVDSMYDAKEELMTLCQQLLERNH